MGPREKKRPATIAVRAEPFTEVEIALGDRWPKEPEPTA
jgi:hypothetical protein